MRLLAINACVAFTEALPKEDARQSLMPLIREAAQDKSWRVRYQLADRLTDLQAAVGPEVTNEFLVDVYQVGTPSLFLIRLFLLNSCMFYCKFHMLVFYWFPAWCIGNNPKCSPPRLCCFA